MTVWTSTACILCECNCGIEVQLGGEDGRRIARVRGDDAHPISKGYACEKPSRLDFYQNGPHRLTKPLRRRADGSFEEIDWDTAIREVAARFAALRDAHGGESIFYYGGGGQGNHLPGAYGRATKAALGMRYQASALSQEKTGEFWVATKMVGGYSRGDFDHCEVALFIGKNPWFSHSIPRARVTLKEISNDPKRPLIVIDPRRTETAEMADVHQQVKPGADAFLLAAMVGVIVQEGLEKRDWLAAHADGLDEVLPHFETLDVASYAEKSGVPEELIRATARRIASAESVATFEDLGVQMNLHSTLVSYLHKLLVLLTGNFGKKGAGYRPSTCVALAGGGDDGRRTPVTGARIIGGLTPCNVIPEEILTHHPKRFRALLVESGNPAHSLADSTRMREALAKLELVVVIDVAFSETPRLAHYVLPVARQMESLHRAGFKGEAPDAGDELFDALLESKSAVVFSVDDWEESFARVHTPNKRIQLAIPELFPELDSLAAEPAPGASAEFPFILSAGERRSFTANTIFRNPEWRRKDRAGALRMNPDDAKRLGLGDGGLARISTKRGSAEVPVELSDRMQPGHVSLPNGLGVDFPGAEGARTKTGVAPNDLTSGEDRDWLAGTPWHKHTPARVERAEAV